MNINVNKTLCTSCGLCWNEYPAFFGYDSNMIVEIKQFDLPDIFIDSIENILLICPGEAITLTK